MSGATIESPILNFLASEASGTAFDCHGLAYLRFVIRESSEADQQAFYQCLIAMRYAKFLRTAYWQIIGNYIHDYILP